MFITNSLYSKEATLVFNGSNQPLHDRAISELLKRGACKVGGYPGKAMDIPHSKLSVLKSLSLKNSLFSCQKKVTLTINQEFKVNMCKIAELGAGDKSLS